MIGISTLTRNTAGAIVLPTKPTGKLFDIPARVSRTATLDGGVALVHSGTSHGDRTLTVIATVTEAEAAVLKALHLVESLLCFATGEGLFTGAIYRLKVEDGECTITIYVKEMVA